MLVKFTLGLNFINVLRTAFALVGPKSVRIQSSSQYLFTLLGSTGVKAVCRTLMKLTLGRQLNMIKSLMGPAALNMTLNYKKNVQN